MRIVAAVALLSLASCSGGGEPSISVSGGWAREVAPGQTAAAAYLSIANRGDGADRLLGASSVAAAGATLHSSTRAGGVARMRPIEGGVDIPGRSAIAFEPGGNHIMLTGLKQPLRAGQTIQLTLQFERSPKQQVPVRVMPAATADAHAHGMRM